jgi:hypothetical protein
VMGVSIGSILQTLEEKNEGVQFVVEDDTVMLTFRDNAQKSGWLPLTEFLKQSKPIPEGKGEKPVPKEQPILDPYAPRR